MRRSAASTDKPPWVSARLNAGIPSNPAPLPNIQPQSINKQVKISHPYSQFAVTGAGVTCCGPSPLLFQRNKACISPSQMR